VAALLAAASINGLIDRTTMRRCLLGLVLATGCMAGCISTAPPGASPLPGAGGAAGAPATPAAPTTTPNGTTVNVAAPSTPCCPHETLPEFLGIKGLIKGIAALIEGLRNRLGSAFPGLESTPPLLAITNPANASSSNPAVAAAAGAKADEDQAPQKIKAIRYLATLGCSGCYPDIEDALLASLDDCTEAVRYEAAKAFRELSGSSCATCKTKSCCSPKVRKKLDEVANKMEKNCYKEPSARVRRMARLALSGCGGTTPTAGPQEGPSEAPPEKGTSKTAESGDAKAAALAVLVNSDGGATAAAGAAPAVNGANPAPAANANGATNGAVKQASAQVRVTQTPMECGCGTTQSASVFIPAAPAAASPPSTAANPQPTPAIAASTSSISSFAAAIPGIATSILKAATLPGPADSTAPTTSVVHSASAASGTVMAEINGQPVFESEVVPEADRQLADMPGTAPADKLRIRPEYIRRQLARVVDRKLLSQEARRIGPQINQASFQAAGNDEEALAAALLAAVVRVDTNITQDQLWACYRVHQAKYNQPAEVRFEQVTARLNRFQSRDEAIAAMNYLRARALGLPTGQPPAHLEAIEVQTTGWTRRDSIPSPEAADLLFRLPIGGITPMLDTGDAMRMDRLLERHAAGPAPLEMVMEEVRQQILRDRHEYLEQAYLSQLRSRAQVWTIFDPPRADLKMVRPIDELGGR